MRVYGSTTATRCCSCVYTVSVYGRLGVNVALNRPAFQSSVMEAYYARRANDGNSYDTAMSDLSCAHTEVDTNPWWAVDFGVALYVFGIKFTNRNDFGLYTVSTLPPV